jgi:hypothetical protein
MSYRVFRIRTSVREAGYPFLLLRVFWRTWPILFALTYILAKYLIQHISCNSTALIVSDSAFINLWVCFTSEFAVYLLCFEGRWLGKAACRIDCERISVLTVEYSKCWGICNVAHYIAFSVLMGILQKPTHRSCFSNNHLCYTASFLLKLHQFMSCAPKIKGTLQKYCHRHQDLAVFNVRAEGLNSRMLWSFHLVPVTSL